MARCSFDVHVQEIFGPLMIGATLVMLHPRGTLDFEYLSTILQKKQITFMQSAPSLLHRFFTFINEYKNKDSVKYLRSLFSSGKLINK